MQNQKEKELNLVKKSPLRLVVARGTERRLKDKAFEGDDKRKEVRRFNDQMQMLENLTFSEQIEHQKEIESQTPAFIGRIEGVLYYVALVLSVNIIFGWIAYFTFVMGK